MKLTTNVNIGGVPFIIDQDAYTMLSSYLNQIESRLSPDDRVEVMEDVENRIAAIFTEKLGVRVQIVDNSMVSQAVSIIGSADDFGEAPKFNQQEQQQQSQPPRDRSTVFGGRFFRSRKDKVLGGVCGALAPQLGLDVTIVRLALVFLSFLTFSVTFWAYVITWIIVPEEPINTDNQNNERR